MVADHQGGGDQGGVAMMYRGLRTRSGSIDDARHDMMRSSYAATIICVGIVLCLVVSACRSKDVGVTREPLTGISRVEIHRGYTRYKVSLDDRAKVQMIVDEINRVRQKPWNEFIGKPGGCAMHLTFFRGDDELPFYLMIHSKSILDMPIKVKRPRYRLQIEPEDIPRLRPLLIQIGLPENCKW
jgi:hypothetical protein